MKMVEVDDLFNKYNITDKPATEITTPDVSSGKGIDFLFNKYSQGRDYEKDFTKDKGNIKSSFENFGEGVKQGGLDVVTTVATGANTASKKLRQTFPSLENELDTQRDKELIELQNQSKTFSAQNPDTNASIGRFLGQTAATLPFVPAKVIKGVNSAFNALPTIGASGEKVAAPLVNRLGASVATGGIVGGEYGALTSSTNDKGILSNTAEGVITGALTGPVVTAAGAGFNKLAIKGVDSWKNINVNTLVNNTGMPASAVKNIIQSLEDAGYTPATAQAELNRLGPKATLADLDASLTAEARALATRGGKTTAVLKGRYAARADQASDETQKIVNQQLGPHVDLEGEKANIVKAARVAVKPDYEAAHASNQVLDAQPIIDDIDKALETAVGSKASGLKAVKSYLFRTFKNANGDDETIPRFSIKDLHETRQGIDDLLDKMPIEGTSQKSSAYRAVSKVRDEVDALLKTNHEMKSADEKFAGEMKKVEGLQTGYDVLKKNLTTDQFAKQIAGQPPEIQDAIKKGMRAYIGDYLEKGSQGEANAAQRLFSKKESNRGNLEKVFGNQATGALDALEREEAFRTTEKAVRYGSDTAQNLSIQKKYGEQPENGGILGQAFKGALLDIATGSPAVATIGYGAKRAGGNALINMSENRLAQMAEGSADILSRSGQPAKNALDIMQRVERVQRRIKTAQRFTPQLPTLKLPVALGGLGENAYEKYEGK